MLQDQYIDHLIVWLGREDVGEERRRELLREVAAARVIQREGHPVDAAGKATREAVLDEPRRRFEALLRRSTQKAYGLDALDAPD